MFGMNKNRSQRKFITGQNYESCITSRELLSAKFKKSYKFQSISLKKALHASFLGSYLPLHVLATRSK